MNAPVQTPENRDDLLARMRELVECLEAGDGVGFEARFASLLQAREQGLFVSVAKLTRNLHDAVRDLRLDDRLANAAGRDIPDACSRLDYVVKVTEDAAHHTLDLVEQCQKVTQEIALAAHDLDGACRRAQAYANSPYAVAGLVVGVDEVREQIAASTVTLREKLSQLAQAQEYQDLAGQVIRRVAQIVRSVETALIDVLRASGTHLGSRAAEAAPPPNGLYGPAVAGVTPAAVSQDDADSLLADLGF
ncbi:MAG TPA: protein phosphatase CheZ [Nevskiaceae bacterium]|nr:protein phosphatase CheZ [Nevskiaceae bacterium]